jgi:hypothetical protein
MDLREQLSRTLGDADTIERELGGGVDPVRGGKSP